ncbi:hypothetical protein [Corynebacterium callunae]|uniref:hypothetical protein n=1 Tax=Corynebacterium callunae TaxID=1721 RepID=UPI001FFF73D9|nr:hypothetical protein [Corynebacterium callunae]MCK2199177.1 hypothetical protein [Corynebacterium callunae]
MAKTLADMTPEERKAYVGMWCEWDGGLRIIGQIFAPHVTFCGLVRPNDWGLPSTADLELVTPRFDLPRAWNPDGTPPEWDWQYADYTPGMNRGFYSVDESVEKGPELSGGTTRARRLVGEWEEDK